MLIGVNSKEKRSVLCIILTFILPNLGELKGTQLKNRDKLNCFCFIMLLQVKLSSGKVVDMIPACLRKTAKTHSGWKGLYGRLDMQGNFATSITDPRPMGTVGMCFHPNQDRILSVRECARSQVIKRTLLCISRHCEDGKAFVCMDVKAASDVM